MKTYLHTRLKNYGDAEIAMRSRQLFQLARSRRSRSEDELPTKCSHLPSYRSSNLWSNRRLSNSGLQTPVTILLDSAHPRALHLPVGHELMMYVDVSARNVDGIVSAGGEEIYFRVTVFWVPDPKAPLPGWMETLQLAKLGLTQTYGQEDHLQTFDYPELGRIRVTKKGSSEELGDTGFECAFALE
jgi:hypothetical protein